MGYQRPTDFNSAIERLKEGNANFVADTPKHPNQNKESREKWLETQKPWAVVLSCADSRVAPELAFDTGVGELFVLRVAGNIANTCTLASIEYAVAHTTDVRVIVVMGHQGCGAVGAAMAGGVLPYSLNMLIAHIIPPLRMAGEGATAEQVIAENAKYQAAELLNRSTIIKEAVDAGKLRIVTANYNLDGTVEI